jgi:hypothetical protein
MHRRLLLASVLTVAGPAASAAAPPRPADTSIVQAIIGDLRADAEHPSAAKVRRGLKAVDIDGDGRPDYLFEKQALGSGWCGSGGCWVQLWLERSPGPPLKIFDGQVRETAFRRAGRGRIVDFDVHGSVCWTFGVHPCAVSFRWDKALGRLVETATPNGRGIVRYLSPIDHLDETPPPVVAAAVRSAVAACTARGGKAPESGAVSVPDIDGDGIRDWVTAEFVCDMPDGQGFRGPPMTLFASAGNAAAPVLAATATRFEIDAAATPAAVVAVDLSSCSAEALQPQACRRKRLYWAPALKRLVARPGTTAKPR